MALRCGRRTLPPLWTLLLAIVAIAFPGVHAVTCPQYDTVEVSRTGTAGGEAGKGNAAPRGTQRNNSASAVINSRGDTNTTLAHRWSGRGGQEEQEREWRRESPPTPPPPPLTVPLHSRHFVCLFFFFFRSN